MFVLGTAGHIDHGKSSLIKAMTGIDPDRLPEEADRGMTIDLGFAWLKLPKGEEIGIIDVPGHERFVRNMVAGAGGINAAMLVIAADDGWMPQTQEHFDIINLLNIRHGLVALTKTDLVENDWLELVKADIRQKLSETFMAEAPIIPVSSTTGEGVPDIIEAIGNLADEIQEVEDIHKSRLFIDRAFVLTGIGVVVTGTSRGGGFQSDNEVYHFPSGAKIKIRSLQSHTRKTDRVGAGQRVAINLTGISREDVARGDVVTSFPYLPRPRFFAVHIYNLANSPIDLNEGRKVLMILGTSETDAILRPFESKGIPPGGEGLAIIKTELPLAALLRDHFILRLPTPPITLGGGVILDVIDEYPRRKNLSNLKSYLQPRINGTLDAYILTELEKQLFLNTSGVFEYSNFSRAGIEDSIRSVEDLGRIARVDNYLTLMDRINPLTENIIQLLGTSHQHKSYLPGVTVEEIARQTSQNNDEQLGLLLRLMENKSQIARDRQFYHLPDFSPRLDEGMKKQAGIIIDRISKARHNYLTVAEIENDLSGSQTTIRFLGGGGKLKMIGNQFITTPELWKQIIDFIEKKLNKDGRVTVAEFRDRFGNSRKYALPVLEYLDGLGITCRDGEYRVKGNRFDECHSL